VGAGDTFCGAAGQKTLPKWPATETHRRGREAITLDLLNSERKL
jgi:hypothetical protein